MIFVCRAKLCLPGFFFQSFGSRDLTLPAILILSRKRVIICSAYETIKENRLCKHEDQAMLAEFQEFDRKIIHEKYKSVVDSLKK